MILYNKHPYLQLLFIVVFFIFLVLSALLLSSDGTCFVDMPYLFFLLIPTYVQCWRKKVGSRRSRIITLIILSALFLWGSYAFLPGVLACGPASFGAGRVRGSVEYWYRDENGVFQCSSTPIDEEELSKMHEKWMEKVGRIEIFFDCGDEEGEADDDCEDDDEE